MTINGEAYQGFWFGHERSILLAESAVLRGQLVRHEMLHAVTDGAHAAEYFADKCAGVVACERQCAKEAGQLADPPPEAPEIAVSSLQLTLTVSPSAPTMARDSGWIALEVASRNPLSTGAWARLEPVAEGSGSSATFGYAIACASQCDGSTGTEYEYVDAPRAGFAASQTRRRVFDVRLGIGTYSIVGTFNGRATAVAMVVVTP